MSMDSPLPHAPDARRGGSDSTGAMPDRRRRPLSRVLTRAGAPARRRALPGVLVSLLVLVFNLLGADTLPMPLPPLAGAADSQYVVCTASGAVTVSPRDDEDSPRHPTICVFCLPLLHGGAVPPGVAALPAPSGVSATICHPGKPAPLRRARLPGGMAARAPPFA